MPRRLLALIQLSAVLLLSNSISTWAEDFPVDEKMRIRVDFWKKVYTEIGTNEAFLHDSKDLTIIYKKKVQKKRVRKERRAMRRLLRSIHKKKGANLTAEEAKVWELIKHVPEKERHELPRRLRYQYGLRDRYYQGLIRSEMVIGEIRKIFAKEGLPETLTYLPHVESSFNYRAYSKVGAAGMWQFMRSTGRRYGLKISYVVDMRRDPIASTRAAAKLLKDNYRKLGTWPLALTAYNHGARSIQRAIKKVGTTDISKIVEKYKGRRFGFASKNFYATFMATVEISKEPEKYFDKYTAPAPLAYSNLTLKRPYTVRQITSATGVSQREIRLLNPAIRPIAYRSNLYLPKRFVLNLPVVSAQKLQGYEEKLLAMRAKPKDYKTAKIHIVEPGDSIYLISKAYRVSMQDLIAYNQLESPQSIYVGTKIKIPGRGDLVAMKTPSKPEKPPLGSVASAPSPTPSPSPTQTVALVEEEEKQEEEDEKGLIAWVSGLFGGKEDEAEKVVIADVQEEEKEVKRVEETKDVDASIYDLDVKKVKEGLYELIVEPEENLGYYAEWADTRAQRIRNTNRMSFREFIYVGQRLRVAMKEDKVQNFNLERLQFHMAIQEDFYSHFKLTGSRPYRVERGDSITYIVKKFNSPQWLLRKVQKKGSERLSLVVGQTIQIPTVEKLGSQSQETLEDNQDEDGRDPSSYIRPNRAQSS